MVDSHAENIVIKENWYDLSKYKDEIARYVTGRRMDLGHQSKMYDNYDILYRSIFAGAEGSDTERYSTTKENFNVYKAALIEACLPGYSALMNIEGRNPQSILLAPRLKKVMIDQFKNIALIEKLSDKCLTDWILKGEAVAFVKLRQTTERFRDKEKVTDTETGDEVLSFKVETGVTYEDIDVEIIDPLDFFVDAEDYAKDPRGCAKIIRSFITSRELLTNKTNYPLLSEEDKKAIVIKANSMRNTYNYSDNSLILNELSYNKSAEKQIEVLTYRGDYVTNDGTLLTNIKAICVEGKLAFIDYSGVDSNQIIYAPYIVDRETHRGISPLASIIPINKLANKCVDLFISNLDKRANPVLLYPTGSFPNNENRNFLDTRQLEYNVMMTGIKPEYFSPPEVPADGMNLLGQVIQQNKDMMGLTTYISGDTSGSVRTAQESQILFQKANARMRVETDVFSYKFLLPLVVAFYSFNRELALAVGHPLNEIYADPELMVSISTGASKADSEGEFNKLMQLLNMPAISQSIFQYAAESGNMNLAIQYIMSKAGLTDGDDILKLFNADNTPADLIETQNEAEGEVVQQEADGNPVMESEVIEESPPPTEEDTIQDNIQTIMDTYKKGEE